MKLINLNNLSEVGVSHNPDIKKKIILEKEYIPNLTTFAQATFLPSQSVDEHSHETMFEVFYILSGKANFVINGKEFDVEKNQCVVIEPKEKHYQSNPFDEPVTWLYFVIKKPSLREANATKQSRENP